MTEYQCGWSTRFRLNVEIASLKSRSLICWTAISTIEDLIQRFSAEEFLLDLMDYSFVSIDFAVEQELDFADLVDLMSDSAFS